MKRCKRKITCCIRVQTEEGKFWGAVTWNKQLTSKIFLSAGRWTKIIHAHLK